MVTKNINTSVVFAILEMSLVFLCSDISSLLCDFTVNELKKVHLYGRDSIEAD